MKRRGWITAIAVLLSSLVLLAGCGMFTRANDDRFPSDVADGQDYTGSPGSFLASQETPTTVYRRMYEEAVQKDGYGGTYLDFLKELGLGNTNGEGVQQALRSTVSVECAYRVGTSTVYSRGSGVIYSLDTDTGTAYVVTNYHVVYTPKGSGTEKIPYISDNITVWLYGTEEVSSRGMAATFVGGTMDYDIAVLAVRANAALRDDTFAAPVVACDSDSVTVGENVYAVGNAAWRGMTVTDGVISMAFDEIAIKAANEKDTIILPEIRTTAPINQGNSGGGLYNVDGELVGIVNARTETDGIDGMGYAIPSNIALAIAQSVIDSNAANASYHGASAARSGLRLGITDIHAVYDEMTGKSYLEEKIVVQEVTQGYAGNRAGIKAGDTLYSVKLNSTRNGEPYTREIVLRNTLQFETLLFDVRMGDVVEFQVLRSGSLLTLYATFSSNSDFVSHT